MGLVSTSPSAEKSRRNRCWRRNAWCRLRTRLRARRCGPRRRATRWNPRDIAAAAGATHPAKSAASTAGSMIDRDGESLTMVGLIRWLRIAKNTTFPRSSRIGNRSGRKIAPSALPTTRRSQNTTCSTCSPTRRARGCTSAIRGLYRDRYHRPLQKGPGIQCAASDRLGRLRLPAEQHAVRPARTRPAIRKTTSPISAADQGAGLLLRLGSGGRYDRPEIFPVDAVDFPAAFQNGPGLRR